MCIEKSREFTVYATAKAHHAPGDLCLPLSLRCEYRVVRATLNSPCRIPCALAVAYECDPFVLLDRRQRQWCVRTTVSHNSELVFSPPSHIFIIVYSWRSGVHRPGPSAHIPLTTILRSV
eukprot:8656550-Pyramimonas_sp.AAC.1